MGDEREESSHKLIRYHKGGVVKSFENQTKCNNSRVDTKKKMTRPTKTSSLFSTLLSPFYLWQCQLRTSHRGRLDHAPERVTASMAHEGEVRHVSEGGGGNLGQYNEGGNTRVDCDGDPTKSG